ncbi:hypothetical protein KIN20_020603 [Parelaphostrongylus tenuis]|uniref:Uncharacterized protein n=1 Tax=Parelaphostrongylus tenuis TaxID=148309 RepID=A0AAD5QTV4_PARTN|nr:hypothetical protein KIN20_020603 [Parelaphostrongylus tenuis]
MTVANCVVTFPISTADLSHISSLWTSSPSKWNVAQESKPQGVVQKANPAPAKPTALQQKNSAKLDDNIVAAKTCRENKTVEKRPQVTGK